MAQQRQDLLPEPAVKGMLGGGEGLKGPVGVVCFDDENGNGAVGGFIDPQAFGLDVHAAARGGIGFALALGHVLDKAPPRLDPSRQDGTDQDELLGVGLFDEHRFRTSVT